MGITPGATASGTGGSVIIYDNDGSTARITVSPTTIAITSGGTVSMTASGTMSLYSSTTMTLDASSGINLGNSYVYAYEFGTVTASSNSATLNTMSGLITSSSSSLAAGSSETISFTNSRITSSTATA